MSRSARPLVVLSLVALAIFFVFLHANNLDSPLDRDEGAYAYSAWLITQGKLPYVDTLEQKPPLIYLPYLAAIAINSGAFWPFRLIAAGSFLLTVILLGLIAGKEWAKRAGFSAMWLILPMAMYPYFLPFAANTEKFLILPLTGLLAIYVYNRGTNSAWPWFWAGVCGALAVLYKQIALPVVIYIILVWVLTRRRHPEIRWQVVSWLLGMGLTVFLALGYFIWKAGWWSLWEQLVVYNLYYARGFGWPGQNIMMHLSFLLANWPLPFLLFAAFLLLRPEHWRFYAGLFLVSWFVTSISFYSHYLIIALPFWAVIGAAALDSLAERLALTAGRPRAATLLCGLMTAVLVFSICWPVRNCYLLSPDAVVARLYRWNPFVEAPLIAKRIAELTGPRDKILITGSEPEILYYAKRQYVSRHGGMYGLMIDQPQALAWQKEMIRELEKERPKIIVLVRSPLSWTRGTKSPTLIIEYLNKMVQEEYDLVGGTLWFGEMARWQEPLAPKDIGFCGLLLCKRK
jgi:hypothetical protein